MAQNSGKKSAFSICFPERIKLASSFSTREAEPVISLTTPVVSWVPACTTAPCQEWGAREQPLPLCSYPGIRECSRCSRATHPSEIPLCLLQRRQKTQFLLPGAKQKNPKPTAVTSSGCVAVTPEQVLLLLLTPTAHGSLPQHTPCSCKNRFPASITQTVPVTQ